ncbi:hypothetical protein AVEN_220147-1 [Araneus ventricosus]|uniref:Uncharacterized protein n=1 Tax=Araneus ventricosus TaxID=182803 RepID=A0A4Y2UJN7_ARAVE|nr:hypothetical protein AVEN_220147-1 [Araneus ventricosus]
MEQRSQQRKEPEETRRTRNSRLSIHATSILKERHQMCEEGTKSPSDYKTFLAFKFHFLELENTNFMEKSGQSLPVSKCRRVKQFQDERIPEEFTLIPFILMWKYNWAGFSVSSGNKRKLMDGSR